jgi:uncharacterized membrane protein
MWLPTPVYEALPYAYGAIGVTMIVGACYLGLQTQLSLLYLGTGTVSVLLGALVYIRRAHARGKISGDASDASTSGDTVTAD